MRIGPAAEALAAAVESGRMEQARDREGERRAGGRLSGRSGSLEARVPCRAAQPDRLGRLTRPTRARGRHDPLRREPHPPGARGPRAGRDRARRTRASARDRWPERLAGRAVRGRRRARQAPVPPLRGRPDDPLAPAHDRAPGACSTAAARWPRRRGRAWLVLAPRRPRGRAVRRPGARADDRRRARASTSGSPRSGPDILAPELDERPLPAPAARGRPDAPDRRRAARPAHDRRDRQPVEGRGLLRGAASTRGGPPARSATRRCSPIVARDPPADAAAPRSTAARTASRRSTAAPAGRARAAGAAIRGPRAGRRQPPDLLVPGVPGVTARASATRAPTTSRRATRSRRSTPRSRTAST